MLKKMIAEEILDMTNQENLKAVIRKHQPDVVVPEIEALAVNSLIELEKEGFTDEDKKITEKGQIATQFQEIPSVAFADFFIKQKEMLNLISTKEYITLFSIFTSIIIRVN